MALALTIHFVRLAMEREHLDLIREVFGHSDGDTSDGVDSDDVPSGTGLEGVRVVVADAEALHHAHGAALYT